MAFTVPVSPTFWSQPPNFQVSLGPFCHSVLTRIACDVQWWHSRLFFFFLPVVSKYSNLHSLSSSKTASTLSGSMIASTQLLLPSFWVHLCQNKLPVAGYFILRRDVYLAHDSGEWRVQDWVAAYGRIFLGAENSLPSLAVTEHPKNRATGLPSTDPSILLLKSQTHCTRSFSLYRIISP